MNKAQQKLHPDFDHNGKRVFVRTQGIEVKAGDRVKLAYNVDGRGKGEYLIDESEKELRDNNNVTTPDTFAKVISFYDEFHVWADREI